MTASMLLLHVYLHCELREIIIVYVVLDQYLYRMITITVNASLVPRPFPPWRVLGMRL